MYMFWILADDMLLVCDSFYMRRSAVRLSKHGESFLGSSLEDAVVFEAASANTDTSIFFQFRNQKRGAATSIFFTSF
jgi:hypothetical protein